MAKRIWKTKPVGKPLRRASGYLMDTESNCAEPASSRGERIDPYIFWWKKYKRITSTVHKYAKEAAELLDLPPDSFYIKETKNYVAVHLNDEVPISKAKYMEAIISKEFDDKCRNYADKEADSDNRKIRKLEEKVDSYSADVEKIKTLYSEIKPQLDSLGDLD
jgi:hypothetical protein